MCVCVCFYVLEQDDTPRWLAICLLFYVVSTFICLIDFCLHLSLCVCVHVMVSVAVCFALFVL